MSQTLNNTNIYFEIILFGALGHGHTLREPAFYPPEEQ